MKTDNKPGEHSATPRRDIFQEVTDRIMRSLEKGVAPWVKPWNPNGTDIPISATGRYYRGINKVVLGMAQTERGYASNQWFTRRMANEAGGRIRKGEKGTAIVYFKPLEEPEPDESDEGTNGDAPDRDDDRIVRWFHRHYFVWNRGQIDGLPAAEKPSDRRTILDLEAFRHGLADDLVDGSGAEIRYGGERAFYSPVRDVIQIPEPGHFREAGGFHSTRFHELVHWTGHDSRLAREYGRVPGCPQYAREELVAEMGSAFLCDWCGIESGLQHPEYIGSWLKVLDQDKAAVVVAATLAQKAFDFVFERAGMDSDSGFRSMPLPEAGRKAA